MKTRKELIKKGESNIKIQPLFSKKELTKRDSDYKKLTNKKFDFKYRDYAFKPIKIIIAGEEFDIQYNFCTDSFCPNFGSSLKIIKDRKSRSIKNYKFIGTKHLNEATHCNIMEYVESKKSVFNNTNILISNWSIAEEIKRLYRLSNIKNKTNDYKFHKESCCLTSTPFEDNNDFYKYGTTKSGSQRYQCKKCSKTTNVNENITNNFSYYQQRNDILLKLIKLLNSRMPVTKVCEFLNIGASTYYNKLEWIYRKCLEFLDRHEKLNKISYDDLYLATDSFVYALNNIRKKGMGKGTNVFSQKPTARDARTRIVSVGDAVNRYIFSTDVCYDFDIRLSDISMDTEKFHFDHTYSYLNKNARFTDYAFKPQPPSKNDLESYNEYNEALYDFNSRKEFVDGLHTNSHYTLIARLFLLKNELNYNNLITISDEDNSLKSAIYRVFNEDFKNYQALYFTTQIDKTKDSKEKFILSQNSRRAVKKWADKNGLDRLGIYDQAKLKLEEELSHHSFYKNKKIHKTMYQENANNPIKHPLPFIDEGERLINLDSYHPYISNKELSEIIMNVSLRTVDSGFQQIRRAINTLERPLYSVSGKSYIYSNYNPKYAHQLLTIFRTLYNFVWEQSYSKKNKVKMTPAQRIGLVSKKYDYKDIIYFR